MCSCSSQFRVVTFECADECICQQGALWRHGQLCALSQPERGEHNKARGNQAVVFLFQAILLPSIYIRGSLAHQKGICCPSVLLSQSGGNVILHHYLYMYSSGRNADKLRPQCRHKAISSFTLHLRHSAEVTGRSRPLYI